jgi:hypothetical protein
MTAADVCQYAVIRIGPGVMLSLTRKQWALFQALKGGAIVGDDQLIVAISRPGQVPSDSDVHRLRVFVQQLRAAFYDSDSPYSILRHRQRGYQLVSLRQQRGQPAENVAV